jgi:hypothetical protein
MKLPKPRTILKKVWAAIALLTIAFPALGQQSVLVPATTTSIPITGTVAAATVIVQGVAGLRIYITSVSSPKHWEWLWGCVGLTTRE